MLDFVIKPETSPIVLHEAFKLRAFVWRTLSTDERFAGETWNDVFDVSASHWVAFAGDQLVAAARMTFHNSVSEVPQAADFSGLDANLALPVASMNRLVVHPDFRCMGLGSRLDVCRLQAARDAGCRTVVVTASKLAGIARFEALKKLGFVPLAPLYSRRNWDFVTPMALNLC
jgi:GNAT superfamily N-acetyltransferase